ncbi:MAG: hypothetical protein JOY59_14255, partial [Candidatus Eremiobacteraeota bacterium]|nr:hypothetical protein [Candidatus Eremiobacteraeota bacterium]
MLAAVALANCSGSTALRAVPPSAGTSLGGVLVVGAFSVPASSSVSVGSPTFINASGPVEIDGAMQLAPGAALIIKAPRITIAGSIGPAPSASASSGHSGKNSAARRVRDGSTTGSPTTFVSDSITVTPEGSITGSASSGGGNVDFVSPSANGTLTINGGGYG